MTLFDPLSATASGFATPVSSKRLRLTVAYDGRRFHGFAAQPGQRTVEGSLAKAISSVVRHEVKLTCAGRTDAGVHAWGQVVHLDVAMKVDPKALARAVSSLLDPEVVVKEAEQVSPDFDARRSAISRRYRYMILPCRSFNPFLVGLVWQLRAGLNLAAMQAASDVFLGEHDFSAFCRRPPKARGCAIERRVLDVGWRTISGELVSFEIEANAFCHQMVRSIVGTLVEVGRGRLRAGDMAGILASKDRARAGPVAPACGLYLLMVRYPSRTAGPEEAQLGPDLAWLLGSA